MNEKLTELVFILDRSGSMAGMVEDTIGGFNSMLNKQRGEEGECLLSTIMFSTSSQVVHDRADIKNVPELTKQDYIPGGCTALLDAIGDAIHHIGNVHKYARNEDRPAHTLFVITTDGMENASRRYSAEKVKQMIERQKSKYGWEFLFLGANIDSLHTAEGIGIDADYAANFHNDSCGQEVNYRAVECAVSDVRRRGFVRRKEWREEIDKDYYSR